MRISLCAIKCDSLMRISLCAISIFARKRKASPNETARAEELTFYRIAMPIGIVILKNFFHLKIQTRVKNFYDSLVSLFPYIIWFLL